MKIEKIEGSKVVLLIEKMVDSDNDGLNAVEAKLVVTLDIVELINEVTKKEMPLWLNSLIEKLTKRNK